jgi:hypothetical protein
MLVRGGGENEWDGLKLGGGQFAISIRDNGAVRIRRQETFGLLRL